MRFRLSAPETERALNARFLFLSALQEFAILLPVAITVVHMNDRGLGLGVVGLAFGLRALIVVLLEVPTGGLADAIGRKPVALLSQAFTLASIVSLLFISDLPTAILYAVLQGVGSALSSGALDAWYVDSLKRVNPRANLQQNLARVELVRSAAMLLGMGLGGALPGWVSGWGLPWPLSGFGVSLFLGALFRVLVWLLTLVLVQEPEFENRGAVAGFRAVPEVLRDALRLARSLPVIPYLLVSVWASGLAIIALDTFWQPLAASRLGASVENSAIFGVFGALSGGALLAGSFVVLRATGRGHWQNSARLAGVMQLLKGLSLVLVGLATSSLEMGLGLAFAYVAIAGNNIPHDTILNESVPDNRRSVMLSLNSLFLSLGFMMGSFGLGFLASQTDAGVGLWVAGAATLVASLAYVGVARSQHRQAEVERALESHVEEAQS